MNTFLLALGRGGKRSFLEGEERERGWAGLGWDKGKGKGKGSVTFLAALERSGGGRSLGH